MHFICCNHTQIIDYTNLSSGFFIELLFIYVLIFNDLGELKGGLDVKL